MSLNYVKDTIHSGLMFASDEDLSADASSSILLMPPMIMHASFQIALDANDAVGVLKLQESNSKSATASDAIDSTNWIDVEFDDGTSSVTVDGADINAMYHIDTYSPFMRWVYDRTSGSATSFQITAVTKKHSR
jgi:hypothetical protein